MFTSHLDMEGLHFRETRLPIILCWLIGFWTTSLFTGIPTRMDHFNKGAYGSHFAVHILIKAVITGIIQETVFTNGQKQVGKLLVLSIIQVNLNVNSIKSRTVRQQSNSCIKMPNLSLENDVSILPKVLISHSQNSRQEFGVLNSAETDFLILLPTYVKFGLKSNNSIA